MGVHRSGAGPVGAISRSVGYTVHGHPTCAGGFLIVVVSGAGVGGITTQEVWGVQLVGWVRVGKLGCPVCIGGLKATYAGRGGLGGC